MKKGNIYNLTKGINLEKSKTLVPWKTSLNNLKDFGNPEIKKQPGREIVVWKNEKIMNGLNVNLNVIYEAGLFGSTKKLKNVSAYISETDFENLKQEFEGELKKGRFKKLNDMELQYSWKINNCRVTLSQVSKFGTYWKIDIKHRYSISGSINSGLISPLKTFFKKNKPQKPYLPYIGTRQLRVQPLEIIRH